MDRNFSRALKLVLAHEGGYVNHPSDPGGATNKGITIGTFRAYVKPSGTVEDLKRITDEQVATVYRRHYWDAVLGAELPDGVDYAVFDFAVNSGVSRAAKYLQAVVGVGQDGVIGPATVKAARGIMHAKIIHDLCDKRMAFLKGLRTWGTFGKGWTNRVTGVRSEALKMTAPDPSPAFPPLQPLLRLGAKSESVKNLQRLLNAHGRELVVDGDFGPKTDAAVRAFQEQRGLHPDGVVGRLTWAALQ
jgi:lysozyme family protein